MVVSREECLREVLLEQVSCPRLVMLTWSSEQRSWMISQGWRLARGLRIRKTTFDLRGLSEKVGERFGRSQTDCEVQC